jgi:glycosyltransferase involved in cell wall biosynthesis
MRGGERVLEDLCAMWPLAEIHTLFYEPHKISDLINSRAVHPSVLQRLPQTRRHYRMLLPLFPWAVRRMRVGDAELVLSVSHCAAKAIPVPPGVPHVCYCLSPARYLYDQADRYFGADGGPRAWLRNRLLDRLRRWDQATAANVTAFIGISQFIAARIERVYGRPAQVVYPSVDTDFYRPDPSIHREEFFLLVCAAVPYKKGDVAVEAFNRWGRRLIVVGRGPELERLRRMARAHIEFRPWVGRRELRDLYRRARGFVFIAEEDFGITPLEAQACGCPVVGYGGGGLVETIPDGVGGPHFAEQTAESLLGALEGYAPENFDASRIRGNAERFSPERFRESFLAALGRALSEG